MLPCSYDLPVCLIVGLTLALLCGCSDGTQAPQVRELPESSTTSATSASDVPTEPSSTSSETIAIDPVSGLKVAPNWELAKANCGACHSYRLVTAQRGNRDYWEKTIEWMQRTQNLWPIAEPALGELLDYLATNYDETEWGRRPTLSPSLLPTN